jgi:hypothetical protein
MVVSEYGYLGGQEEIHHDEWSFILVPALEAEISIWERATHRVHVIPSPPFHDLAYVTQSWWK